MILRGTVGVDRLFSVWRRDLYLIAEYQHDGFGAASSDDLFDVVMSVPFQRGELQVLSRDALAVQASYQIHPLWGIDLLTITSLVDGSVLLSGGGSWSVASNSSLRGGFFIGIGDDTVDPDTGFGVGSSADGRAWGTFRFRIFSDRGGRWSASVFFARRSWCGARRPTRAPTGTFRPLRGRISPVTSMSTLKLRKVSGICSITVSSLRVRKTLMHTVSAAEPDSGPRDGGSAITVLVSSS